VAVSLRGVEGGGEGVAAGRAARLLQLPDVPWLIGLMAVACGLRVLYWSGYGLGDDVIFRGQVNSIVRNHWVLGDNGAYRFSWWFPAALSCRIFGMTEIGMVLPSLVYSTLGIGLLYAFGKALWGRPGGIVAALLLTFAPLDFAWSTMVANDIVFSFFSGCTILCVLRALEQEDATRKRRAWAAAAVSLWLAYHAKVSGVLLVPAVGMICWAKRQRLGREFLTFCGVGALLFAGSALVSYVFFADPLWPLHSEVKFQGLVGEPAIQHKVGVDILYVYLRWLFQRDSLGDLLYSIYPHVLVALVVLSPLLGLRSSLAVFWWFFFVFMGMEFNLQRAGGFWIAGFRNIRHGHAWLYPLILLLTGYLVSLRARAPRVFHVTLAVLLAVSAWQSVSTATKTQQAFADRRNALRFLSKLPPKPVYSDFQIHMSMTIFDMEEPKWPLKQLNFMSSDVRRVELAAVKTGYLVTGGGREPYYGCIECIPRAAEVSPDRWQLLREFPGPTKPTPWRFEPIRVWQAKEASDDQPGEAAPPPTR